MREYFKIISKPLHFITLFIAMVCFTMLMELYPKFSSTLTIVFSVGIILIMYIEYLVCKKKRENKQLKDVSANKAILLCLLSLIECILTSALCGVVITIIMLGGKA